jgi:SET domain-containing protein
MSTIGVRLEQIEVKQSPIHGSGLFASDPIPESTFVGTYHGRVTEEDGIYVLWVEREIGGEVYGIDGENELRFLNHSPEPNAEFDGAELWTLRDISPGEELTIDYGEEWA